MEIIRAWLAGQQDYQAGLALYEQYGESQILKITFRMGATAYNAQKLAQALAQLAGQPAPAPAGRPAAVVPDPGQAQLAGQVLAGQLKAAFQIRSHFHSQLEHTPRQADRGALAFQILDKGLEIDRLLRQKTHLDQTGQLPADAGQAAPAPATPLELEREIKRLGVRISKHKDKPGKADLVAQLKQERDALREKLNQATAAQDGK